MDSPDEHELQLQYRTDQFPTGPGDGTGVTGSPFCNKRIIPNMISGAGKLYQLSNLSGAAPTEPMSGRSIRSWSRTSRSKVLSRPR